ncbi:DMSO reductase chain C [Candidatus Filomicrobium marinum]|uniref:DMSO reductase chain C n=2 Tax=Filomicrobium TaxID=119044 RepID=A0A0D6JH29_9HYPH|nr:MULTISPECIES: DmsC/YnfH family molybdoenzyme membrane anchor subunit [Filomicrobium]MCV0369930.1 dimethyl sulfoxide reductase anchor subunit [Filomicrobium sp.]CFX54046.1 DMSO reductase chain C [Candidatus Filomicrobium marinum]CPR19872.1 DMSO reductase chain C [Candidatus Filomicrobium marinum]SDP06519.1 DMSO reductase anchor subunit [Filomicrobium insigne]
MHPAYSVIFFTTASGAGYGLLIWMAIAGTLGVVPPHWGIGFAGLGLALALITAGLLSSTFHLGRPERSWRAFSQWRSSWLSREGVLAVATYAPAGLLGISWVFFENLSGIVVVFAIGTVILSLCTVWATGMIYASLPPIRSWHQPWTAPVYVGLALASGGVLFHVILAASTGVTWWTAGLAVALVVVAFILKTMWWQTVDGAKRSLTVESATGLGRFGKVGMIEAPHSRPNFVMREMGYHVARKHAKKLRTVATYLIFLVPPICLLLLPMLSTLVALPVALTAAVSAGAGLLVERWLFFAEADHAVMLFYGADKA